MHGADGDPLERSSEATASLPHPYQCSGGEFMYKCIVFHPYTFVHVGVGEELSMKQLLLNFLIMM